MPQPDKITTLVDSNEVKQSVFVEFGFAPAMCGTIRNRNATWLNDLSSDEFNAGVGAAFLVKNGTEGEFTLSQTKQGAEDLMMMVVPSEMYNVLAAEKLPDKHAYNDSQNTITPFINDENSIVALQYNTHSQIHGDGSSITRPPPSGFTIIFDITRERETPEENKAYVAVSIPVDTSPYSSIQRASFNNVKMKTTVASGPLCSKKKYPTAQHRTR